MITHIHHINFVVKRLELAVSYFQQLLNQTPIFEDLPQRNVTTARFKVGECFLVLVQPETDQGIVADILAKHGEGIFLISFATESLEESLSRLSLEADEPNAQDKRTGLDGWHIHDISQYEQFGAILQLTTLNISK